MVRANGSSHTQGRGSHEICAQPHGIYACGQSAHRAVHMAYSTPQRRKVHSPHRGHRSGASWCEGAVDVDLQIATMAECGLESRRRPRRGRPLSAPMFRPSAASFTASMPTFSSKRVTPTAASAKSRRRPRALKRPPIPAAASAARRATQRPRPASRMLCARRYPGRAAPRSTTRSSAISPLKTRLLTIRCS